MHYSTFKLLHYSGRDFSTSFCDLSTWCAENHTHMPPGKSLFIIWKEYNINGTEGRWCLYPTYKCIQHIFLSFMKLILSLWKRITDCSMLSGWFTFLLRAIKYFSFSLWQSNVKFLWRWQWPESLSSEKGQQTTVLFRTLSNMSSSGFGLKTDFRTTLK